MRFRDRLSVHPLNFFCRIREFQPLTVRGVAAIVLGIVALKVFAIPENDLIAYMLGGGICGLFTLLLIVVAILRFRLGQSLDVDARFSHEHPLSKHAVPAGLILEGSALPAFFYLSVSRRFDHPGAVSPEHILRGGDDSPRHLVDTVRFPHRGLWTIQHIDLRLSDACGFTSFVWSMPLNSSIEVSAPRVSIRALPVVASSSRAGDEQHLARERSGDLYDLKPYDPSDGITRILWKTYAKSGQLIVRRPEPAVIPEGEVAIYLIARRDDDHVAGALESYLDLLEAGQIVVLLGADGLSGTQLAGRNIFDTPLDTRRALNLGVWSGEAGTGRGFNRFLDALESRRKTPERVIVFAPEEDGPWIDVLAAAAKARLVKLSFAIVPRALDPFADLPVRQGKPARSLERHVSAHALRTGSDVMICEANS